MGEGGGETGNPCHLIWRPASHSIPSESSPILPCSSCSLRCLLISPIHLFFPSLLLGETRTRSSFFNVCRRLTSYAGGFFFGGGVGKFQILVNRIPVVGTRLVGNLGWLGNYYLSKHSQKCNVIRDNSVSWQTRTIGAKSRPVIFSRV